MGAGSAYMRGNGPRSGSFRLGLTAFGRAAQPEGRTPIGMNFQGQHRSPAEPVEPVEHDAAADAKRKVRRSRYAWIGTGASIVLFAVSLGVLWKLVQSVSWAEVRSAIAAATAEQLGLAFLFVGVSYVFLTGYDALALRQLKIKVPYRITALASFTSYAVSFTLGFPLLTAGTIRYWIYARQGLSTAKIAALTVIAGFTFWLGMAWCWV